jgi:membrane associated rhomboid family serine protease
MDSERGRYASVNTLATEDDDDMDSLSSALIPPFFKCWSFTIVITLIEIAVFVISLVIRKEKPNLTMDKLLEPPPCALYVMGAKWTSAIRYEHQYWRFVMPLFLHGGLFHMLSNILCQVYIGFLVEKALSAEKLTLNVFTGGITWKGSLRLCILYVSSSIGGVLLSAVGDPLVLTIGASCAVLGIVGVLSVFLFMVWLKFLAPSCFCWQDGDRDEIQLFRALCLFSVLVAGLTFVAGALTPAVDNWGHVGGFVTGILLGPAFMPPLPTNGSNTTFFSRNFQWMSVALLCILVFRLLLHMYTMPLQNNPMKC